MRVILYPSPELARSIVYCDVYSMFNSFLIAYLLSVSAGHSKGGPAMCLHNALKYFNVFPHKGS